MPIPTDLPYKDDVELARHPKINSLIETDINHIQKDLANFERVRKFTLLDRQFTIEDGELTPTQKVRRKAIEERYRSHHRRHVRGYQLTPLSLTLTRFFV